jgi:hypothetical protein
MTFARLLAAGLALVACVALGALWAAEPTWSPWIALVALVGACAAVARQRWSSMGLLRPSSWFAAAVGVILAVAIVTAVMRLPGVLTSGYRTLTGPAYSQAEADLQPLSDYGPPAAVAAAAAAIPADVTYSVVGGDINDNRAMYRFWLAPREFNPDYHQTRWVIVSGEPYPADLPRGRRVELADGVYALEVSP